MIHELVVKGVKSADELRSILSERLSHLLELAPSDASGSSYVKKVRKGYLGIMHIFSSQGRFVVKAAEKDFNDLIKALHNKMHSQIKVWRNHRVLTA